MEENTINLDELLASAGSESNEKKTVELDPETQAEPEKTETAETDTEEQEQQEDTQPAEEQAEDNLTEPDADSDTTDNTTEPNQEEGQDPEEEAVEPESETESTGYKFKDDFIKKAVEYYEKFGTLTPYLEATQINYDELSDVDVLKLRFNKDNADLSEKARTRLFEKHLEQYNLDSFDEDEIEIGQALLKRDANKLRQSLKDEQQQFIQSIQPEASQEYTPSKEELAAQQEQTRKVIQQGVSKVIKDNMIRVEVNGEGINYQVQQPQVVVDYALDSSKFLSTFAKDGEVDWDKWTKVVAFAENPTQFINELIKHGKSLGRKAMEAELKNASLGAPTKEVIETPDIAEPQDDPVAFLKGMVVRK